MQHKSFRQIEDLLSGYNNYVDAYAAFLQSGLIPSSLEDDMYGLLQSNEEENEDSQVSLFCMHTHISCKCTLQLLYIYF